MKKINVYIFEKFKINSKTLSKQENDDIIDVFKNDIVNKLYYYFNIDYQEYDCEKEFKEWADKYKVKDIEPVAYKETLKEYENKLSFPKKISDLYNISEDKCLKCEELFDNTNIIYEKPDFIIYGSKDIIGIQYEKMGILYCLTIK